MSNWAIYKVFREKVETKLRARIDPDTATKIMMYTDMLKRRKRAIGMNRKLVDIGDYEIESNEEEPPLEWRNDWFKTRKNMRAVM